MKKSLFKTLSFALSLAALSFALHAQPGGAAFSLAGLEAYRGEECEFEAVLPEIPPAQVQILEQDEMPEGTRFLSAEKFEASENSFSGTKIRARFSFSNTGVAELPAFRIMIGNAAAEIPFDSIEVKANPKTTEPEFLAELFELESGRSISLHPEPEIAAGTRLKLKVSARFCTNFGGCEWRIPENAIFFPTAEYEFAWEPLLPGRHPLPFVSLEASSLSGRRSKVSMSETFISVLPARKPPAKERSRLFSGAFEADEPSPASLQAENSRLSKAELEELASSYRKQDGALFRLLRSWGILPHLAVFAGGPLRAVPEDDASSARRIKAGSKVEVVRSAGAWLYVSCGSDSGAVSGWVRQEELHGLW